MILSWRLYVSIITSAVNLRNSRLSKCKNSSRLCAFCQNNVLSSTYCWLHILKACKVKSYHVSTSLQHVCICVMVQMGCRDVSVSMFIALRCHVVCIESTVVAWRFALYCMCLKTRPLWYLYLQGAWIKFIQFCCTASEHFEKLCLCLLWRVRSCYLDSASASRLQWHCHRTAWDDWYWLRELPRLPTLQEHPVCQFYRMNSCLPPNGSIGRHGRTEAILSRLYCTMYTHNMADWRWQHWT